MRRILLEEKGMALLITIMVISLLIVVTVQFGRNMHRQLVSAANLKDNIALDAITRSGMNMAIELIDLDSKISTFGSYHAIWGKISGQDLSSLFEQGTLKLTVSDLSGRLQVNSLVSSKADGGVDAATAEKMRQILKRLLLSGNFALSGENNAQEIIDALVEWMSPVNPESNLETKDSYYGSAEHPYGCKHGPVSTVEELLLARGISPELLYGDAEHLGLAQFLTAQGNNGKININTADPLLLQAIDSQMTQELAKYMVEYREQENNTESLLTITWYKQIPSWPIDVSLDAKLITTQSSYFMITAISELDTLKRKRTAIVHRSQDNKGTALLSMKVD